MNSWWSPIIPFLLPQSQCVCTWIYVNTVSLREREMNAKTSSFFILCLPDWLLLLSFLIASFWLCYLYSRRMYTCCALSHENDSTWSYSTALSVAVIIYWVLLSWCLSIKSPELVLEYHLLLGLNVPNSTTSLEKVNETILIFTHRLLKWNYLLFLVFCISVATLTLKTEHLD